MSMRKSGFAFLVIWLVHVASAQTGSSVAPAVTPAIGQSVEDRLRAYDRSGRVGEKAKLIQSVCARGSCYEAFSLGLYMGTCGNAAAAAAAFRIAEQRYAAEMSAGVADPLRPPLAAISQAKELAIRGMAGGMQTGGVTGSPRRQHRERLPREVKFCNIVDNVHGLHGEYTGRRCPACSAPRFPGTETWMVDESKYRYRRSR